MAVADADGSSRTGQVLARKLHSAADMRIRDTFLLTSLLVVTACPPSSGTSTEPGTTDDSTASSGEPTSSTTEAAGSGTNEGSGSGTTEGSGSGTTEGSGSGTTEDPTAGTEPLYVETCAELRAGDPAAVDGDYTLYVGKDPEKPWTAFCKDMAGEPAEYLVLVEVQEGRNFSQYTAAEGSGAADVRTHFTHVRIDPVTLVVDIDDLTFSSSTGEVDHGGPVTSMPYGVAEGCSAGGVADGVANIDLVGTPFKVVDPYCTKGAEAAGEAVFSLNDQVVDLTGGGFCGWTGPTKGDECVFDPHSKNSGFVLELGYIGGSAPPDGGDYPYCANMEGMNVGCRAGLLCIGGDTSPQFEGSFCSAPCTKNEDCPQVEGPGLDAGCYLDGNDDQVPEQCAILCTLTDSDCPGKSMCEPIDAMWGACTWPAGG